MIDGMITKLLAEANEEADHKGWSGRNIPVEFGSWLMKPQAFLLLARTAQNMIL